MDSLMKLNAADLRGPMAAVTYSVTSICIMLFNKAVLSEYGFKYPKVLTLLQSTATLLMMTGLARSGAIKLRPLEQSVARQVAPLSFLFLAYVVISLSALGNVNMPMFTALRRTTVIFVMAGEYVLMQRVPSFRIKVSTGVMLLGAIIAASNDLTTDMTSITYVLATNVSSAMYTVFIARVRTATGLDVLSLLYYNTVITTPFLFVYCFLSGELSEAMSFKHAGDPAFQAMFVASMFLAFLLNWTTFRNTTINSPMTQTVVGQVKNFIAFIMSLFLFSDYVYNATNFFGLLVGFAGGVMYGVTKVLAKMAQNAGNSGLQRTASAKSADGMASNSKPQPV